MSLPLLLVIGSTGLSCLCLVLKITWWLPASHSAITASLALLPATSFLNMNFWINFLWLESVACYQGWCRIKGRLLWRQNSYDFSKSLICQKQRIKLSMGLLRAWIPASLISQRPLKLWSSSSFHCDFSNDLHVFLSFCLHCSLTLGFKGLLSLCSIKMWSLFLGPFSWFP